MIMSHVKLSIQNKTFHFTTLTTSRSTEVLIKLAPVLQHCKSNCTGPREGEGWTEWTGESK